MTILRKVLEERWLFFIGLFGLAVGLPLSRSFVSIAPAVIFAAWVFDGLYRNDFVQKWQSFKINRVAIWTTLLFAIYIAWSLNSDNEAKALRLVVDKVPLLLLPLSFSGIPFTRRRAIDRLFGLHIAAIVLSSAISYVNWKLNGTDGEIRDSLLFVNHIRLSLMMVLAIIVLFYDLIRHSAGSIILRTAVACWFVYFMYQFQLATGFGILLFLVFIAGIRSLTKGGGYMWLGFATLGITLLTIGLAFPIIDKQFSKPPVPDNLLQEETAEGSRYWSIPENLQLENGHYVWHYIQLDELKSEWNKRSDMKIEQSEDFSSLFLSSLIRYMTSKGLRKDAEGVRALTDMDVRNIENGQTSVLDSETSGIQKRLATLCLELDSYHYGGDPSLSSLTVKFEYWKTGWRILKQNMWTGVGVGDVRDEFDAEYEKGTRLAEEAWDKTHNQYLTWAITFGLIGGIAALWAFIMPTFYIPKEYRYLVMLFYLVFLTSFLMEDTLENQLGLNLYLFYLGMLVLPSFYFSRASR